MNTVPVHTSQHYNVYIGNGIIHQTGAFLANLCTPNTAAVISDSTVWPLYGKVVTDSLEQAGFRVIHFVFSAGEKSKTSATYLHILDFLANNEVTKKDCLIALGGGVVGDITGFCAATFLRGIPYIQIPTSLLAMVDSSVGGKTAIDLPSGKNLVGAFYQPKMVLCDISVLSTLSDKVFTDGCAEIIKYGVLYDKELFSHLWENGKSFDQEYVITRCIQLKCDVVTADELDTGCRQKLNLGHTIGHAIEQQSNYSVTHGEAVSAGMAIIARGSYAISHCNKDVSDQVCGILSRFSLPVTTVFSAEQLHSAALSDKKRDSNSINLILPKAIGSCDIFHIPLSDLLSFIKAGLL